MGVVETGVGRRMSDEHEECRSPEDEVVVLRRRVAELERVNKCLSDQVSAACRQSGYDLLDTIPDIVYTTDRQGIVRSMNRAVKEMFGFEPSEIIGTRYNRWAHESEWGKTEAALAEVLQGGRVTHRIAVSDKEGRERYVEISVSPLMVKGRIEGTQGVVRDVTAHHDAERCVRESEATLRALFNAVRESIFLVEPDGRVLALNETAARRLGHSVEEMIGRKPTDVVPSRMSHNLAERREAVIRQVAETGQAAHFEDERAGISFEISMYPVFDAGGTVANVAVFARDVTEHKQLQRQLQESEERYRVVVETAGETIAVVDAQGVFAFMNTTAAQRLGGQAADLVGKTMWELFPKEIADRQVQTVRRVIETREGVNVIVPTVVQGELRWYNTTVEPLKDSAGAVTAALLVARDIHELRTAQQELETYREKMIRAEHVASLGTLSAMLSHEMTQPLTVIRLSIQNAMETLAGTALPPTVLEDLKDALAEVSHVTAIVRRLREFTGRLSDGAVANISLAATAHRVMRLLEESARKARVALEVHSLEELPPIQACGRDVEQIFFALAQNAIQAAAGTRDRFFRVLGAQRDGGVELQFADDCGGIAPEVLEHIFEPFFTTKPPGEGTGLGLCLVERIVSQAGGRLKVDSHWGQGTTFFVTLPIETKP
jgi:PAS domain S-box-containing protein